MPRGSLSNFVFRHYLRSAVIPILTLELLLLLVFFVVAAWVSHRTEDMLRIRIERAVPYLVRDQIRQIESDLARGRDPGASPAIFSSFLIDDSGRVSVVWDPYGTMGDRKDSIVAAALRVAAPDSVGLRAVNSGSEWFFLARKSIPGRNLSLVVLQSSNELFRSVHEQTRIFRWIGLGLLVLMVVFYWRFFHYLRRNASRLTKSLADPLESFAEETLRLGTGADLVPLSAVGIKELDRLASNFNKLASELETRSRELVQSQVETGLRAKEAELAYARGLFESASGYLHNVGNLTTRFSSCLMDLEGIVHTEGQYPEMFRRIREDGGAGANLDRLEDVLVGKVFPAIAASLRSLEQVRNAIHQTIEHQQEAFLETRHPSRCDEVDLTELVDDLCREFAAVGETRDIRIETDLDAGVHVRNNRNQIAHGLRNGLRNAFDAIGSEPGLVRIVLRKGGASGRARVTISDTGSGVPNEGREKLFTAGHTTKAQGHGLGLHSFAVFLSANNGCVKLESEGPGCGASLDVEVGDV